MQNPEEINLDKNNSCTNRLLSTYFCGVFSKYLEYSDFKDKKALFNLKTDLSPAFVNQLLSLEIIPPLLDSYQLVMLAKVL